MKGLNVMKLGIFWILFLGYAVSCCGMEAQVLDENLITDSDSVAQAKAKLTLGKMLLRGQGCEVNYDRARVYFEEVAAQNIQKDSKAWALIYLAIVYHLGQGVAKNQEKVVEYVQQALVIAKQKLAENACDSSSLYPRKEKIQEVLEVGWVLERGSYVAGWNAFTHLHEAAYNGYKVLVEVLLATGADVHAVSSDAPRQTPLHSAVEIVSDSEALEVVQLLLAKGADLRAVDQAGNTPLHVASYRGLSQVVEFFIEKGVQINAVTTSQAPWGTAGSTPLLFAAKYGSAHVVKLLLAHGADINAVDNYGWNVLHFAAYNGHADVIELLLKRGADVRAVTKENTIYNENGYASNAGSSVLDLANKSNRVEIAQLLVKALSIA